MVKLKKKGRIYDIEKSLHVDASMIRTTPPPTITTISMTTTTATKTTTTTFTNTDTEQSEGSLH